MLIFYKSYYSPTNSSAVQEETEINVKNGVKIKSLKKDKGKRSCSIFNLSKCVCVDCRRFSIMIWPKIISKYLMKKNWREVPGEKNLRLCCNAKLIVKYKNSVRNKNYLSLFDSYHWNEKEAILCDY